MTSDAVECTLVMTSSASRARFSSHERMVSARPSLPVLHDDPIVHDAETLARPLHPAVKGEEQALARPSVSPVIVKPPPTRMVRRHALFRKQAVAAYLSSMRESEVVRIAPPWSRGILFIGSLLVVVLLAASFVVKVEQTGRGRGVLRVPGGAHSVAAQAQGIILELGARPGDVVEAGTLLAKIDSTATKTALLEAERQIQRAEQDVALFIARRDKEEAQRIALLRQRSGLLHRRARNQRESVGHLRDRLGTFDRLAAEGLASTLDRGTAQGEVAAGERSALQLDEEISSTQLQIAGIASENTAELQRRQAEVQRAKDRRDALVFQLAQTEIRAPHGGRVEAMVVKVGDSITAGMPIARLLPEGPPTEVVIFLPEADRAFLDDGSEVRIELDQLPTGEFGSLKGTVTRIATDLASHAETSSVLGDTKIEGAVYRIDLAVKDEGGVRKLDKLIRPSSLVTARFVLRTRPVATLLLEPLKRFFD